MDQLKSSLSMVKLLRTSVAQVFDTLGNGISIDNGNENQFQQELQEILQLANTRLRDLESNVNGLTPPPAPFSLGNTAHLSQETTQERQVLYSQLVNSYKWIDKVHEYGSMATTMLAANGLKRSYSNNSNKRRRPVTSNHNVPPMAVDNALLTIDRGLANMNIKIWRPFAANAIVHVTLGRVLKAAIIFKGIMIEWVTIKGFEESFDDIDDMWSESRHQVFRKIQDHGHSAMLHFYHPTMHELALKSYMTWLHSYENLFSEPCKRCGNYLLNAYPPTWRDLRTLEPMHEVCKPPY